MFLIRPAEDVDHDQVLGLIHRLQAEPCHHIGYHGETEAEIAAELTALRFPATTFVATDGAGDVRGVLSADVDPSLGRAWWYGPYVDVPAEHPAADRIWLRTAEALFAAAQDKVRGVTDHELYGHVAHCRLAILARRQGFPDGEYSSVLTADGVDLVRMIGTVTQDDDVRIAELPTPPADSALAESFIRLHETSFPQTYLSAAAILAGGTDHTVVVATHDGTLVGYALGNTSPQDYFVDFVAVAPEFRGRRVGSALVTTLVQRLAERSGARPAASAVVAGGNAPSRKMLRTLGFTPRLELVSYRRHATSLVA